MTSIERGRGSSALSFLAFGALDSTLGPRLVNSLFSAEEKKGKSFEKFENIFPYTPENKMVIPQISMLLR